MCAQAAQQTQNKKRGKQPAIQLNFTELEDLFLNTKGKALRNLRKKMDKYRDLEKSQRKGELQPNAQQKEQIASIPALKAEIDELEALCKLYMESNPNFAKKRDDAPPLTQADIDKAVKSGLAMVSQLMTVRSILHNETHSLVEASDAERASLDCLRFQFNQMSEENETGSETFKESPSREYFVSLFSKLATKSEEISCDGGVSFADLNSFVSRVIADGPQILQRIAEKELAEERAAQAALEKEKAAADAKAKAEAAAAKAEADAKAKAEADAKKAQEAPAKEESKDTPAATDAAKPETQPESQDNQDGGNVPAERGGRGERRGRGEWRGDRRGRGGQRGRGGRGGYHNNRREDDDGFITETGEKPKSNYRGNNYRGRRGDRGDFRGGRGDRGDRRGRGDDRRGGRPPTAGADTGAATQQQPAAAQNQGAQATNNQ